MLLILLAKISVTEKDLFSLAARKRVAAHHRPGRKLMRSQSELNRNQMVGCGGLEADATKTAVARSV